jgi:carbon-monoxide dehydrogenase medium subunit
VLAGGQSLMPMLSMRLAYVQSLVDINRIDALEYLRRDNGSLLMGTLTRHAALEDSEEARSACPLLAKAAYWIGHRSIRNRGTVGGSLAHADPAAELPAVMTALGASVTAVSQGGKRQIAMEDLFEMPLVSTLAADEMLSEIRVPCQAPGEGSAVVEIARRHGDFAIAGVAARAALDADGSLSDVHLVSFATGPTPIRLSAAEAALKGARPEGEAVEEAGRIASTEIAPSDDIHASAEYRRSVTAVLVRRAIAEATDDARGQAAVAA